MTSPSTPGNGEGFKRIQGEPLHALVDELVDRAAYGCILLNIKGFDEPVIVYHAEQYDVDDMLQMIALMEIAKDWFKTQIARLGEDGDASI